MLSSLYFDPTQNFFYKNISIYRSSPLVQEAPSIFFLCYFTPLPIFLSPPPIIPLFWGSDLIISWNRTPLPPPTHTHTHTLLVGTACGKRRRREGRTAFVLPTASHSRSRQRGVRAHKHRVDTACLQRVRLLKLALLISSEDFIASIPWRQR